MDLILWRHADAQDGAPDLERRLTRKGHQQAARVAQWLRQRLPGEVVVVASPAARAQETAAALGLPVKTEKSIAPGAPVEDILRVARGGGTVIVVGHQPDLGNALAYLLTGEAADWQLQKGALWWIGRDPLIVKAVVSPDLL